MEKARLKRNRCPLVLGAVISFARARGLGAVILFIYIFLLAPSIVVVGVSLDSTGGFSFPPASLSLRWYASFLSNREFMRPFLRVSLVVALGVSFLATLIGGLAAIGLVRFRGQRSSIVEAIFLLPIVVPGILLGAALFLFYTRIHLQSGLAGLLIGHLIIAVPYVVRTVVVGLAGISLTLEEAAMSLGATPIQAFLRVTVPLIRSSLLSGAIFAFIVSFSDINLALFISQPGLVTLPMQIFSQITVRGDDPTIAAASAIQIALIVVLLMIVRRFLKLRVAL